MADEYVLADATSRLALLAQLFDPWTFAHLERLVTPTSRCWEVGAGGPSVVRWLAARTAGVLATDIDVSELRELPASVEVLRHDVTTDPPPAGTFDLVHARLVLLHLRQRERALRVMIDSLAPGGWLVIEDADPALQPLACIDPRTPEEELANQLRREFRAILVDAGADLAYARRLPRQLREAGLVDVVADAYFAIAHPACAPLEQRTIEHVRRRLVDSGRATDAQIDRHLAAVASGKIDCAPGPLITVNARRQHEA